MAAKFETATKQCADGANTPLMFFCYSCVCVQAGWYEFDEDATLNRAIMIVNAASAVRLSTLITFRTVADPAMGGPGGRLPPPLTKT